MKTLELHDDLIDLIHQLVSEGRYKEAQEIAGHVRRQDRKKRKSSKSQ